MIKRLIFAIILFFILCGVASSGVVIKVMEAASPPAQTWEVKWADGNAIISDSELRWADGGIYAYKD